MLVRMDPEPFGKRGPSCGSEAQQQQIQALSTPLNLVGGVLMYRPYVPKRIRALDLCRSRPPCKGVGVSDGNEGVERMALTQEYSYGFERFWKAYPRKVNKGAAWRAWQKLKLSDHDVDELVLHLERRKKDDAKWVEGKFIPHAASFLNGHRWLDEYEKVKRHWSQIPREPEPVQDQGKKATPEQVKQALAEVKKALRIH